MSGSSDRKINYNLRPSKSIERKMILEVLKEVCVPIKAKEYRYVGFGSSFFTDFKLFHKGLNINEMISIEGKKSNENRVLFNKPYSCIEIKLGQSTAELPKLNWDKKNIVWLDYESGLKQYMFEDIETCSSRLKAGSFLIISLRRDFEGYDKDSFEEDFGENVFPSFKKEDLEPSKSAETIQKMFTNKINDVLGSKYGAYKELGKKVVFKQLFNFAYKDDARMYTFGGMFIGGDQEAEFAAYNFNSLDFVNSSSRPYDISFPIITNREYHVLNALLPCEKKKFTDSVSVEFIPAEHKESYYNTYKYYPAYIEIMDM